MKKINWKQIGWRIIQSFILLFMNGASVAYFVMDCVYGDVTSKGYEISYFQILPVKWRLLIYLLMIVGVIVSFYFVKLLWKNKQAKKYREIKEEENNNQKSLNDKLTKIIDKITKE